MVHRMQIWLLSIVLRVISSLYFKEFLLRSPEFVVPHNSFRRLVDGIYMRRYGLSPYESDMLHSLPILLDFFAPLVDRPEVLLCIFIIVDILIAEILGIAVMVYLRTHNGKTVEEASQCSLFVIKVYLFNPIAIGTCIVLSLSVLNNLLLSLFVLAFVKGWLLNCAILLSVLTHLSLYQIIYLAPLCMRFPKPRSLLFLLLAFIFVSAGLVFVNYISNEEQFTYIDAVFMYQLDVRDLSPNLGVFWYFFTEVFNYFRLFFLWVFQINIFVYLLPLSFTLRSDPFLLLQELFILVSVFSSYPSVSDNLIYFCLLSVFSGLNKYLRWRLIIHATMFVCLILAPVMWRMWIVDGSGNANFYFSVALLYSVAQILLLTDLLYSYIRSKSDIARGISPDNGSHDFFIVT